MLEIMFYMIFILFAFILVGFIGFCLALLIVKSYEEQNDKKGGL